MPARLTRIRLFAGCGLFALAIGGFSVVLPALALAQPAGRGPAAAAATQVSATQPVTLDLPRAAALDVPRGALHGPTATATQEAPHVVALPATAQKFFAAVRTNF